MTKGPFTYYVNTQTNGDPPYLPGFQLWQVCRCSVPGRLPLIRWSSRWFDSPLVHWSPDGLFSPLIRWSTVKITVDPLIKYVFLVIFYRWSVDHSDGFFSENHPLIRWSKYGFFGDFTVDPLITRMVCVPQTCHNWNPALERHDNFFTTLLRFPFYLPTFYSNY